MSVLDFIASLVNSLAWPTAVFLIAYLLRAQLRHLLDDVTRGRFRGLGFEGEWEREVSKVKVDVALTPPTVDAKAAVPPVSPNTSEDPTTSIMTTFDLVEFVARQRLARTPELEGLPFVALARASVRDGVLDANTADALEGLAVLRNLAVHTSKQTTPAQALEFRTIAAATLYGLGDKEAGGDLLS